MTGGALNLSLLSRGVGEVQKNGHEKVEVFLEPEDYYNFSKTKLDSFYLPPLRSNYQSFHMEPSPTISSTRSPRDANKQFRVPKTFTTRKGALLLFSEDLAQRNMERAAAKKRAISQAQTNSSLSPASSLDTQVCLNTVEDLASSILKYGSHDQVDEKVHLKFVKSRRENFERQIRPGYSAKRYLSTWTRTWDNTVFSNVIKKGYITERSLYHYNLVVPNLRRRLFYEDLSHMPQPYRLMRNMLMMPGSLSGYTFYRAPTQFFEEDEEELYDPDVQQLPSNRLHSIRVIKTRGGVQEEVAYSDLDRQSQKDVITDLLVKSAVHYALKKQEEIYEESLIMAVQQQQELVKPNNAQHEFDMREAVESLLDSHHGRYALGADLPEIDNKSHQSEITGGSFKGAPVPPHQAKQHIAYISASHHKSNENLSEKSDKEYMGGIPVVGFKESGSTASDTSSVPHLPPIRTVLSPIKDVSRETTSHNLSLPPIGNVTLTSTGDPPTLNVHPATPMSQLTPGRLSTEATRGLISRVEDHDVLNEDEEAEAEEEQEAARKGEQSYPNIHTEKGKAGRLPSELGGRHSFDSAGHGAASTTSGTSKLRPQWKASQQSLRKGASSEPNSIKGSMIMAPDGEIISVGGSVVRGGHDVGNMNDVIARQHQQAEIGTLGTDDSGQSDSEPDEWRANNKFSISQRSESNKKSLHKRDTPRSSVTEKDIMDTLTEHAQRIAESVLSQPAAGFDLERDVQKAAAQWSESHPPRPLSRAASVREFRAEAIRIMQDAVAEIMRNRRSSSAAPSAAEYRNLIKKSLATAAAKAAGLDPETLSNEADISDELLEALASQKLTPDQIEVVSDADGRTRIQSRVDLSEALGGVEEGHIFIAPGNKADLRQISIPADRTSQIDDMEYDHISYQGTEVASEKGEKVKSKSKPGSIAGGSKPGSKPGSIAGGTMADLSEMEGMMAALDGKMEQQDTPQEPDDFIKAVAEATGKAATPVEPIKISTSGKTTPSSRGVVEEKQATPPPPIELEAPVLPAGSPTVEKAEDAQSVKSGKTGVSQKSEASKDSKKKGKKTPEQKEEPFVVGKPKDKKPKKEPVLAPKKEEKKKKGKKGKKGKKKEEEAPEAPVEEEAPPKPPTPVIEEKIPSPRVSKSPAYSEPKPSSPEYRTEDESDYEIIREASSPELETIHQTRLNIPSPPLDEEDESEQEQEEGTNLKSISNREARAAKRAAAAAKRREEVERRRREKEEQAKKEKEEVERQVALQREMEEERRRREEERRLRKENQREQELREQKEAEERERRQRAEAERERKAKEDYQRKLEDMKRKQHEEELRKHELMLERQREEEERRREEEEMMAQMQEAERLAYEEKKRQEEEERKQKEIQDKIRRAEEARKAMEEAQRLAEEMAKKQAELEARLKFNRALQDEASNMSHSQEINRAFVFSYYELLQWLGLDIPEFELAKLADY